MRLLKRLVLVLGLLVGALIGIAFVPPGAAHVERSSTIDRPAADAFAAVDGYRRFNDGSPWAHSDLAGLGETVEKAFAWAAVQGDEAQDRLVEDYSSDPGTTPLEQLRTRITLPVE